MCDAALKHYEKISTEVFRWNPLVPEAIKFYKDHGPDLDQTTEERVEEAEKLLDSALHALRSYQYGNYSPDLAEEIANKIVQSKKEVKQ